MLIYYDMDTLTANLWGNPLRQAYNLPSTGQANKNSTKKKEDKFPSHFVIIFNHLTVV